MKRATADSKPDWFKAPAGVRRVTLCRLSGQLATDECKLQGEVYDEYVVTGTVSPAQLMYRSRPPRPFDSPATLSQHLSGGILLSLPRHQGAIT